MLILTASGTNLISRGDERNMSCMMITADGVVLLAIT